jgi:putative transposase
VNIFIFMLQTHEKKHRLGEELYRGEIVCSFTICVRNRVALFVSNEIFKIFEQKLLDSLSRNNCGAQIYLFMPDHCHLLIEGRNEDADLWRAVVEFKQKTGFWLSRNGFKTSWQKDFFDHILRRDEDVLMQTRYILNNPCRQGIADDWRRYPLKGSTIYDFSESVFEL